VAVQVQVEPAGVQLGRALQPHQSPRPPLRRCHFLLLLLALLALLLRLFTFGRKDAVLETRALFQQNRQADLSAGVLQAGAGLGEPLQGEHVLDLAAGAELVESERRVSERPWRLDPRAELPAGIPQRHPQLLVQQARRAEIQPQHLAETGCSVFFCTRACAIAAPTASSMYVFAVSLLVAGTKFCASMTRTCRNRRRCFPLPGSIMCSTEALGSPHSEESTGDSE
jgi:hypothetical protein